jgi:hypothetical protein
VFGFIVTPSGSPVCVKVKGDPSGSLTAKLIGEMRELRRVLLFVSALIDGIENVCSAE